MQYRNDSINKFISNYCRRPNEVIANCIGNLFGKQKSLNKKKKEDTNQVPLKDPRKDDFNHGRSVLSERLERGGGRENKEHNCCGFQIDMASHKEP